MIELISFYRYFTFKYFKNNGILIQTKEKMRTVLITGAGSGIGKGIAESFITKNYKLYLVDRNQDKLAQTKREFLHLDSQLNIQLVSTDLSTEEGMEKLFKTVPEVDVVVNNVGYYENIAFFELTDEQWTTMIHLNFMLSMRISKFYFAKMLQKKEGRLIFISSESALNPDPEKIHYCVAKSMLLSLSSNLSQLTKHKAVTVNCVLPGPTLTEGTQKFITTRYDRNVKEAEIQFMHSRPSSLLGRLIRTNEIGHAVTFLADENAGAINGTTIRVDGGIVTSLI